MRHKEFQVTSAEVLHSQTKNTVPYFGFAIPEFLFAFSFGPSNGFT